MITGESKPVLKEPGDPVVGGTLNGEGALRMRVTRTGEETALAQIIALVKEAQVSKPPVQRLADRAAHWLTILRPEWGALIMSASTVIVALNALLLRGVDLGR